MCPQRRQARPYLSAGVGTMVVLVAVQLAFRGWDAIVGLPIVLTGTLVVVFLVFTFGDRMSAGRRPGDSKFTVNASLLATRPMPPLVRAVISQGGMHRLEGMSRSSGRGLGGHLDVTQHSIRWRPSRFSTALGLGVIEIPYTRVQRIMLGDIYPHLGRLAAMLRLELQDGAVEFWTRNKRQLGAVLRSAGIEVEE